MTRDLYAVLGDLTREIAQHPVSADDDERIEGDVIEALSRRANYREAMRKRGRLDALYATQRAAEPWMEPLATRLWGTAWAWHVTDGAPASACEIVSPGPIRYASASLRAERRWPDGSSGPPMISVSWPSYEGIKAWDQPYPSGREARSQPEWEAVQDDYTRADAAARLESRYRAYLAMVAAELPAVRRREARSIMERRAIVAHFEGLLQPRA